MRADRLWHIVDPEIRERWPEHGADVEPPVHAPFAPTHFLERHALPDAHPVLTLVFAERLDVDLRAEVFGTGRVR